MQFGFDWASGFGQNTFFKVMDDNGLPIGHAYNISLPILF